MTEPRHALVVGITGLAGRYTAAELKRAGWCVTGLSRSDRAAEGYDAHLAVDLADAGAAAARLGALTNLTHVFICTWSRQETEAENIRVNGAMLETLFAALPADAPIAHVALVTGLKHYLGPFEAYAANRPYTPFLESQPRLDVENFYYAQEDVVFAAAAKRGFTWSVHRPHTMIGLALGNAMNMAQTLAVYASICKHTGRPFVFPGSPQQYEAVADVTDARILAKQLLWAADTPEAANTPFNIANGDLFRWHWLWGRIAAYFGIEPAAYPGHPVPLEEQMADAAPIWAEIVDTHGLAPHPLSRVASFWHTDADLGREIECFTDMTNSRRLGFAAYQSTPDSFFDVFDALRAGRIIPAA